MLGMRPISSAPLGSGADFFPFQKAADAASLVMQAVIVPGDKTREGILVSDLTRTWFDIVAALGDDPSIAFQIPPRRWEEIVAGAYTRAGFETVIVTPRSGDFGRDVIAEKRGIGTIRVIDQVKAYKPGHLVTADDVRALLGVLVADGASIGFLTTTSDFAPRLREDVLLRPFIPSKLQLLNGTELLAALQRLAKGA